jgi:NAD(P)-dependent dehydrogenase (short-subunit alcohol dehydrogenase family)
VTGKASWRAAVERMLAEHGRLDCADALKASGHGSVINISSIFGFSRGFGTAPAYHSAKGAVWILTKNVALHWAAEGVPVLHPAFIRRSRAGEGNRNLERDDGVDAMRRLGER